MKKFIFTMLFSTVTTCIFAQTHLSFEGISMGNTVSEFSKQLKSKGYIVEKEDSTIVLARGLYLGDSMSVFVHGLNSMPHYVRSISILPITKHSNNKTCDCETITEKIKSQLGKTVVLDYQTSNRIKTMKLSDGEINIFCDGVNLLSIEYKDKTNDNHSLFAYISQKSAEKQKDESLHIAFKGIPVMGTVNDFCNKLSTKGFSIVKIYEDGTAAAMSGDFAERHSTLYIIGTNQSHFVQGIIVYFDEVYNKWQTIKNDYNRIVEQYITKYGTPYNVDESFDYPYEEGDGHEMTAIKLNKCNYRTTFKLPKGNIVIRLTDEATIQIIYRDNENATQDEIEKDNKIQSDI